MKNIDLIEAFKNCMHYNCTMCSLSEKDNCEEILSDEILTILNQEKQSENIKILKNAVFACWKVESCLNCPLEDEPDCEWLKKEMIKILERGSDEK